MITPAPDNRLLAEAERGQGAPGHRKSDAEPVGPETAALNSIASGLDQVWITTQSGKKMIAPNLMADLIARQSPIAVGGETLHRYVDGAYRGDGERWVRATLAQVLGKHWKATLATEVLTFLRDASPRLWERPPRDKLNCRNGILDLTTGVLGDHDPKFLSPVQIGAAYDPEATCPVVDRFVGEVLADDLTKTVHELAGYLLTPDNSLKVAVMLLGAGDNGKSRLLDTLTALIGRENVASIPLQTLDESRFATAGLYGKLANIFADLDARALKGTSAFKTIVGGDAVYGEEKFKDSFSFVPFSRMLFSANEAPSTPDASDAYFSRWLILPFEKTFKGEQADRDLARKLTTPGELSGLLNHAVAALPSLIARGQFKPTETTKKAASEFRLSTDTVAAFIDECCRYDPDGSAARSDLYAAFGTYCQASGRAALGNKKLYGRVRALGREHGVYEDQPHDGVRRFVGIELLPLRQRV